MTPGALGPQPGIPPAPRTWAAHLAQGQGGAGPHTPALATTLTAAEAARVQRHRDQLMNALRARDRVALLSAKQQVLEAAFSPCEATGVAGAATAPSPALRRALRDLTWRMAALLLPRSPRH
ncbi:hypothetical protein [Acidovorax sp. NB1]|uniref:hypothetical protein n=1 Tax=Acidovorax sp. NB1 TaxID=1943571 RepID=UPI0010DB2E7E|nr:hypothetical protein [Acidovorax sp. NB1]GDY38410.1 hypothetical protein ACINB_43020 [Acidovorax sp. NB1]